MTFLFHYILYSGGERNQRQRYRGKPESEEEERRQSSHKIKKTSGFTVFVDENTMAHPTKESCCFLRGTFCWANEIEARSSTSFTVTCCFLAPSVPELVYGAVWYLVLSHGAARAPQNALGRCTQNTGSAEPVPFHAREESFFVCFCNSSNRKRGSFHGVP